MKVKITFLGTAAADGIPALFCECEGCDYARKHKGHNLRKRSSYVINEDLLVDMGPDLLTSCANHDVLLSRVKYALVSHSHLDHFFIQNLRLRAKGMRKNTEIPELTFVAGPSVMTLLNQNGLSDKQLELKRRTILPFESMELAPYQIQTIKATHYPEVGDAMNYIINDGNKKLLIASDTGIYEEQVWPHLENAQLDALIIEATCGTTPGPIRNHLNIKNMEQMVGGMKKVGAVTNQTEIYASHFSHQHVPPHEELSEMLEEIGVHCGYDGLVISV